MLKTFKFFKSQFCSLQNKNNTSYPDDSQGINENKIMCLAKREK